MSHAEFLKSITDKEMERYDTERLLDKQIASQNKSTRNIIIAMAVVAFIGAGTTLLNTLLSTKNQPQPQLKNLRESSVAQKTLHQNKGTKSYTQTESVLTNVSSPNPTLNQTTNSGVESGKVTKKERSR